MTGGKYCQKLGLEDFIKCGVRHSLISLLVNHPQDRAETEKLNSKILTGGKLDGGGPKGATFVIWE